MQRRVVYSAFVAMGVAILAGTLNALLADDSGAPKTAGDVVVEAAVWLVAIAIWAAITWRLFESAERDRGPDG